MTDFYLDRPISQADLATLEASLDRMVEADGRAINVVTIDREIIACAGEFLRTCGYLVLGVPDAISV